MSAEHCSCLLYTSQLDYGTTSNGISFERTLQAGIYTKLDLYYYTNHACMYNKSNITYVASVSYTHLPHPEYDPRRATGRLPSAVLPPWKKPPRTR